MSSAIKSELASEDLRMFRRVLDGVGYQDMPDEEMRLARLIAAQFLVTSFDKGFLTELELGIELLHHQYMQGAEWSQAMRIADLHLSQDEHGAPERLMLGFSNIQPDILAPAT